jgi:survival motor neuron protein
MPCRAVFSQDGLVYDATIISVHEEDGSCIVSYIGYGNEEEHNLTDLRRLRKRKRHSQSGDGVSEVSLPNNRRDENLPVSSGIFSGYVHDIHGISKNLYP